MASEATKMAVRGNMYMYTRVVEFTEFNSEVRCDLRGHLASEATKMAVKGKMHMGTKVVEVTEFNSEVRCDLRGCFEAAMASEAIKMAVSAICTWIPE